MNKNIFKKELRSSNINFLNLSPKDIILKVDQDNPKRFKLAISLVKNGELIGVRHELNVHVQGTNSSGWKHERFACISDRIKSYTDSNDYDKEIIDVFNQIKKGIKFTKNDYSFYEKTDENGKVIMTNDKGPYGAFAPKYECDGPLYNFIYFLQSNTHHDSRLALIIRPGYWKKKGELHDVINDIMRSNSYSDMDPDIGFVWKPNFIYLYALIKNIQNPEIYPLYFKEWQKTFEFYNEIKCNEYDKFLDFYKSISIPKKYNVTRYNLFAALIDVLKKKFIDNSQTVVLDAVKSYSKNDVANSIRGLHKGIICCPFDLKASETMSWFDHNYKSDAYPAHTSNVNDESSNTSSPLNQILFGPPGTGKTYHTINEAIQIVDQPLFDKHKEERDVLTERFKELLIKIDEDKQINGQIGFVTFHQSFSYEDFIEGIKPVKPKENDTYLKYEIEDGIFKKICDEARKSKNVAKNFVLIIDEINRGNVSSIFGELITLIEEDKREGNDEELSVILPYSKEEFKVPKNVYIIGTMNTADRSIEALDTALRRRFSFIEKPPEHDLIRTKGELFDGKLNKGKIDEIDVVLLLSAINTRLEKLIDKDHKIGHSYFLKISKVEELELVFKDKVIPLLEEYFFGDFGKISLVLGNSFIAENKDKITFAEENDYDSNTADDLLNRSVWKRNDPEKWKYKGIYEKKN